MTAIEKSFFDDFDKCLLNSAVYRIAHKKKYIDKNASNLKWLKYVVLNGAEVDFSGTDVAVARNILSFQPKYFQRATVGGIAFKSRGSWRRETQLPKHSAYGQSKFDLKGSDSSELNLTFRDKESYSC